MRIAGRVLAPRPIFRRIPTFTQLDEQLGQYETAASIAAPIIMGQISRLTGGNKAAKAAAHAAEQKARREAKAQQLGVSFAFLEALNKEAKGKGMTTDQLIASKGGIDAIRDQDPAPPSAARGGGVGPSYTGASMFSGFGGSPMIWIIGGVVLLELTTGVFSKALKGKRR